MKAIEVKKDVYWVGAIDWNLRNFHGYTTERGATYNAYLIIDKKVTLIDCVKKGFEGELLERIASVIDPSKIDYIISNHVEMDHSGALPSLMQVCRGATIVTSSPSGVKGLLSHYGEFKYLPVKAGDSLNIGKRTLSFVPTPMLHWPDNMITFCKEDEILYSNDAFGQHLSCSERFDEDEIFDTAIFEAKKYFANILMPYSKLIPPVVVAARGLNPKIIAPSHGIIWRSNVDKILSAYDAWGQNKPKRRAAVVYDSMWHSTEIMAKTILETFISEGVEAKLYDLKENHISNIIVAVLESEYIAVGSPTLNNGMMPTVASFLCYMKGLSPKDRKAFAFGSFGWSGQSVALVEAELASCGFEICLEKQRVLFIPTKEYLATLSLSVSKMLKS